MTRNKIIVAALLAAIVGYVLWPSDEFVQSSPLVPSIADNGEQPKRVVTAHELLNWARQKTPMSLLRTLTDVLPNGLALTMIPLFVDWESSELEGDDAFVLVRNVGVGGNPVAGTNLLATVRIPLVGVESLEWCNIRDRNEDDEDTLMGHAQLRFVFDPAFRPVVLNDVGEPFSDHALIDDIIISWEAWRPPLTSYQAIEGLQPDSYALSTRAYSGERRFLKDALRNKSWACYLVALPETPDAARTAFLVSLGMGDALSRRMIQAMAKNGEIEGAGIEDLVKLPAEDVERLRAIYSDDGLPQDPLRHLMGHLNLSYNTLLRSCITQSITAIQLAVNRIHADHNLGPPPTMDIVPDLPEWVDSLATASRREMIARLPDALLYLANNTQIVPGEAYKILADADLIKTENGKLIVHYYHAETTTPYGRLKDNMM